MPQRAVLQLLALSLASIMLALALPASVIQTGLLAIAVASGIAALAHYLRHRPDPYDLSRLWDEDEPQEETPADYDSVHCIHCSTVYSSKLPTCPVCGRR